MLLLFQPPFIRVSDVISKDLPTAVQDPNSPFKACSAYINFFVKYGNQYGSGSSSSRVYGVMHADYIACVVPSIMLASFALQESSCKPNTIGGAGEQGLMQLTKDKCGGAPNGNCLDPDFNIRTGARYFSETLNSNGGDLLKSIGMYNGWTPGLTYVCSSFLITCESNAHVIGANNRAKPLLLQKRPVALARTTSTSKPMH
jgi:hypothetical protein